MREEDIRILRAGAKISKEGKEAFRLLLDKRCNVVIGASAGTGKTTLLTELLAEVVIREAEGKEQPDYASILDSIIATTFTVEAAREIRDRLRELLTAYHKVEPLSNFDTLLYVLEQESWIMTIDALTQRILRSVSVDMGIPPETEIIDDFENNRIRNEVIQELRNKYRDQFDIIDRAYEERVGELLGRALDILSLYVISPADLVKRMERSHNQFYESVTIGPERRSIKEFNEEIVKAFKKILPEFVRRVRAVYDDLGKYTYDELRTKLVQFLRDERSEDWKKYFGRRVKYLFLDEFQDTSYAQTELLSHIIGEQTTVFIIGDPKQSIYTWRDADPTILASIIGHASKGETDSYFQRLFTYIPITENYRSVPPLVELANYLFSEEQPESIFNDRRFTGDLYLPCPEITSKSELPKKAGNKPPHIHHFVFSGRGDGASEAEVVADVLGEVASGQSDLYIRKSINGTLRWVKPRLGDCAVLIPRRGAAWRDLRARLIERGIPYVMIQDQGLYHRPEVSLLIDFLDWLGNPFRTDALLRILRSPFVGASDYLLRVLAQKNFRLDACKDFIQLQLESIEDETTRRRIGLDLLALKRIMNLKRNLRWSREDKKSVLIEAILQSSHFREIIMAYPEGEQCVANLSLLCGIVDSWEEDEILPYEEMVERLKFYRSAPPSAQSQGTLSELENDEAVKVATIHATKGLEFPIVFVIDVNYDIHASWRWTNSAGRNPSPTLWYHADQGSFIHLRQIVPRGTSSDSWKAVNRAYTTPTSDSGFPEKIRGLLRSFVAEKWRLYYVALTRARDHIIHGHSKNGTADSRWGNEFRVRLQSFVKSQQRRQWVRRIRHSSRSQARRQNASRVTYQPNPVVQTIEKRFLPAVVDPTHVYDLLLCPRRYQYGCLMNAAGIKCDETGHSQFSRVFGAVLHKMLERFDYVRGDINSSLRALESEAYLRQSDLKLLHKAVRSYAQFAADVGIVGDPKISVVTEKQVHYSLMVGERAVELRGVIDLMSVTNNEDINIYDIKTNYLGPGNDASADALLREFLVNHHNAQLLTYKGMLERMGYHVTGVCVMAVTKERSRLSWDLIEVKSDDDILAKLEQALPLPVDNEGLEARKSRFCEICEFKGMCEQNADSDSESSTKPSDQPQ